MYKKHTILIFIFLSLLVSGIQAQTIKYYNGFEAIIKHSGFHLDQTITPDIQLGLVADHPIIDPTFRIKSGLFLNRLTMDEKEFFNFGFPPDTLKLGKSFYLRVPVELILDGGLLYFSLGLSGNLLLNANYTVLRKERFKRVYLGLFAKLGRRMNVSQKHDLIVEFLLETSITPSYGYTTPRGYVNKSDFIELGIGVGIIRR